MHAFSAEFASRKQEIESYLALLNALDQDAARIVDFDDNNTQVTVSQKKVCKASCYLLMYNLVEATVMQGIQSIYNRIKDEDLSFSCIMEKLRKVWWHSRGESISSTGRNELIDTIYNYYCDTLSNEQLEFNDFVSGVSGNLDADGVRKVCHRYGITPVGDGRHMANVKQYRNWLAHGNKSFSEIGQDVTVPDLVDVKNNIFAFLDEYVNNVNTYLDDQKYKAINNTN